MKKQLTLLTCGLAVISASILSSCCARPKDNQHEEKTQFETVELTPTSTATLHDISYLQSKWIEATIDQAKKMTKEEQAQCKCTDWALMPTTESPKRYLRVCGEMPGQWTCIEEQYEGTDDAISSCCGNML